MTETTRSVATPGGALPVLAIDAGQTAIRARLTSDSGAREQDFPALRTDLPLFPQVAHAVATVLADEQASVEVSVGISGLTSENSRPADLLELLPASAERVYLAHDSITGFLGSIGLEQGTVTAVGTGVVTLAAGADSVARVDGWGNLIGDAGSAYWIGRAGLEAGMRAYDGRAPHTSLLGLLTENFSHPEEAYIELQSASDRVTRIAGFSKTVIALAETDAIALEIVTTAGRELALSAVTAAKRVGLLADAAPRFSWTGSVMLSNLLRASFSERVRELAPHADLQPPLGHPIDGVLLLGSVPDTSPLQQNIFSASRA